MIVHYVGAFGKGVIIGLVFTLHTVRHLRRLTSDARRFKWLLDYIGVYILAEESRGQGQTSREKICMIEMDRISL